MEYRPRTMEQLESQLGAADVVLSDGILDRIDEIVPPGTNLADETGYTAPALDDPMLRRRQPAEVCSGFGGEHLIGGGLGLVELLGHEVQTAIPEPGIGEIDADDPA